MLIDTHCHLDAPEFDEDRDAVITAARQAGLGAIVVPAVFRRNWDTVQALAEREPDVWFALGLHPLYVNDAGPDDLEHLRQRVMAVRDHPRFVGIGKIRLDYFWEILSRSKELFHGRKPYPWKPSTSCRSS